MLTGAAWFDDHGKTSRVILAPVTEVCKLVAPAGACLGGSAWATVGLFPPAPSRCEFGRMNNTQSKGIQQMLCRRWVAVLLVSSGPLLFASACDTAQEQAATAENVEAPVASMEPLPEALDFLASLSGVFIPADGNAQAAAQDEIEVVATSPRQWTGIGVASSGRIYVSFPRWSDDVPISVGSLRDNGSVLPFPDADWNSWQPGEEDFTDRFVAVQSVVATGDDVWVLDTGRPRFGTILPGAPRLFRFDGDGRKLAEYPADGVVKPNSYLNDVRFSQDGNRAYITDSGAGGLVVIDLETGAAHRALDGHPSTMATGTRVVIDGTPWGSDDNPPKVHADGIALFGEHLYYQALTARTLYRVPLELLEKNVSYETRASAVQAVAEVGPSDGLIAGPDGSIYLSSLEHNAVRVLRPDGATEVVAQDPLIAWPDSFSFGPDGALYVTTSRIHQGPVPPAPYGVLRIPPR